MTDQLNAGSGSAPQLGGLGVASAVRASETRHSPGARPGEPVHVAWTITWSGDSAMTV